MYERVKSEFLKDGKLTLFSKLPNHEQGHLILSMSHRLQEKILGKLHDDEILKLVSYLDPDDATDIIQRLTVRRGTRIVARLQGKIKERVKFLLRFHPESAAGLMNLDYIEVDAKNTLQHVAKLARKHERRSGKFPTILVVKWGLLLGELKGDSLITHNPKELVSANIRKVRHIRYDAEEDAVLKLFKSHPHDKIVVLDDDEHIMGVIYSDDILQMIQKSPVRSLSNFAGVSKEEDILDSALLKVKHRYWWLIINLGTAFFAAWIVGLFQNTIEAFVLLAVYMPIVAGMGGNAATQTLAVVVRGLAFHEVTNKNLWRILSHELIAGTINGAIVGLVAAIVAWLLNQNPLFGLVLFTALIFNLFIAALFGTITPLIMEKFGKDPATSATIFITTATDVCGFFFFLEFAKLIL